MTLDEIIAELHDADSALGVAKSADDTAAASAQTATEAADKATQDRTAATDAHAHASQLAAKAITDLQAYFGTAPPAPVQPAVARAMRR